MIEINLLTGWQLIWTLLNFGLVYCFFQFYFYPRFKAKVAKRHEDQKNREGDLAKLSAMINAIAQDIEEQKIKIKAYKEDKIAMLESEVKMYKQSAQEEINRKYLEIAGGMSKEELDYLENEVKSRGAIVRYAQLICESITGHKVSLQDVERIYEKMNISTFDYK